jgi:hypothetical protein
MQCEHFVKEWGLERLQKKWVLMRCVRALIDLKIHHDDVTPLSIMEIWDMFPTSRMFTLDQIVNHSKKYPYVWTNYIYFEKKNFPDCFCN